MSDEQTMPDVIYARPAGNGCGWWYPQVALPVQADDDDADTPYLRCPDSVDPSTIAKGLADMATTIATLTAELDIARRSAETYRQRMLDAQRALAQLKEQDDE